MLDGDRRASTVDRRRYHHTTTAYIYLTNFGISSTHNTKKHTMKERPIIDRGWMVGLLFFLSPQLWSDNYASKLDAETDKMQVIRRIEGVSVRIWLLLFEE